jgi:hypothetical protein
MKRFIWLLLVLTVASVVLSQEFQPVALDNNQTVILDTINAKRASDGLVHLVPNQALNQVASVFLSDLITRALNNRGDVFITNDNRSINDVLTEVSFTPYDNLSVYDTNHLIDFFPVIVRDFDPTQLLEYLIRDARQPQREVLSRRMVRNGDRYLPIFDPRYREIGIAYGFNQNTNRHYYVIVTGSQPGVLPIIVTDGAAFGTIARTVSSPDITLFIHDERNASLTPNLPFSRVRFFRISEIPDTLPCPVEPDERWQRYINNINYSLSPSPGLKTVYVQLCDEQSRSTVSSTQVTLLDTSGASNDVPVPVLEIVNATQTAAFRATQNAPIIPTVEAILTATAQRVN